MFANPVRSHDAYRPPFRGTSFVWPKTPKIGQTGGSVVEIVEKCWPPGWQDHFHDRAGIMEYDDGQIWINAIRAAFEDTARHAHETTGESLPMTWTPYWP